MPPTRIDPFDSEAAMGVLTTAQGVKIGLEFAIETLTEQREQILRSGENDPGLANVLTRMIISLENTIGRIPITFGDEALERLQLQGFYDARDITSAWRSQQERSANQLQATTDQSPSQANTADAETATIDPAARELAQTEQATSAVSEEWAFNTMRQSAINHGRIQEPQAQLENAETPKR